MIVVNSRHTVFDPGLVQAYGSGGKEAFGFPELQAYVNYSSACAKPTASNEVVCIGGRLGR
jgi:hypothetical protein